MKQSLLFTAIVMLLITSAHAQPVFHASDINPQIGDKDIDQTAKIVNVKLPKSGANVTWDYSKLKDSSKADTTNFIDPSKTKGGKDFPSANLASTSTDAKKFDAYYNASNAALSELGAVDKKNSEKFLPPFRILAYPLTYHTTYSDTGTIQDVDKHKVTDEHYADTALVIGYGTLKLPGGRTFNNVLLGRIKTTYTVVISGHNYTETGTTYDFLYAGVHGPILTFSVGSANSIDDVQYSPNATPAPLEDFASQKNIETNTAQLVSVYPNPARSSFTVNMSKVNGKTVAAISVYDMSGRNVFRKQASMSSSETISCAGYKAGVYTVKIEMTDGTSQEKKVIVQN